MGAEKKKDTFAVRFKRGIKKQGILHLMLLPMVVLLAIFSYYPMAGILIAFEKYNPKLGFFKSTFIGLQNFQYVLKLPNTMQVLYNTVYIALLKMVFGLVVPVVFAILLDLVRSSAFKRCVQTLVYIPYFLSWVVLSGILIDVLSPSNGIINQILGVFGIDPIFFLGDAKVFPEVLVVTDVWKNFGYGTVVYLAAITAIDPALYEAAKMDGANRFQQVLHITLPGMAPIIVMMATLSLGNVLNAGFEQVLNLYNTSVMSTGDIIDTFVYRIGLQNNQYGIASAVGLFKSLVSLLFISVGYRLAYRFAGYKVF